MHYNFFYMVRCNYFKLKYNFSCATYVPSTIKIDSSKVLTSGHLTFGCLSLMKSLNDDLQSENHLQTWTTF